MIVKVFYHDKCFDGACSASLFTGFYRERIRRHAEFQYQALVPRAGQLFNVEDFTGNENAIVDFKYLASEKLTWWFDHHQSAFLSEADTEHFEQEESNKKFFDPGFQSCTKFIANKHRIRVSSSTCSSGINPDWGAIWNLRIQLPRNSSSVAWKGLPTGSAGIPDQSG